MRTLVSPVRIPAANRSLIEWKTRAKVHASRWLHEDWSSSFSFVTEPLPQRPVHYYPKNYADGVCAIETYQQHGYSIEYVNGELHNPLKPGYLVLTPPAGTHTYSPEAAEIHKRVCDSFGYASDYRWPGAVRTSWSSLHTSFFAMYHSESLWSRSALQATTPQNLVCRLVSMIRAHPPWHYRASRQVIDAYERVATVLENRWPAAYASDDQRFWPQPFRIAVIRIPVIKQDVI